MFKNVIKILVVVLSLVVLVEKQDQYGDYSEDSGKTKHSKVYLPFP